MSLLCIYTINEPLSTFSTIMLNLIPYCDKKVTTPEKPGAWALPRHDGGCKVGQASSLSPASTPVRAVPFHPGTGRPLFGGSAWMRPEKPAVSASDWMAPASSPNATRICSPKFNQILRQPAKIPTRHRKPTTVQTALAPSPPLL